MIDFQNNSTFNPVCVKHTSYYCAGYSKGYRGYPIILNIINLQSLSLT